MSKRRLARIDVYLLESERDAFRDLCHKRAALMDEVLQAVVRVLVAHPERIDQLIDTEARPRTSVRASEENAYRSGWDDAASAAAEGLTEPIGDLSAEQDAGWQAWASQQPSS